MQFSVSLPSRAAKRARKATQDARVSGGSSESAQDARRSPERITRASMPSGEGTTARYDDSSDGYARTRVARRASPRASCEGEQLRGYPKSGRLPRARRRTPPPGRRARPAVSPARAHDSKSTPRPRRAASATQKRARATRKRAGEPPRVFEKKVRALDARARRARTRASRAEARARRARWKGVVTAGEAYLRRWCGRTHRVLVEVTRCSSSSGGGDCASVLNVRRLTLERSSGQVSVS